MTLDSEESPIVVLGIGNSLVGDDGVGPFLIQLLAEQYHFHPEVLLVDGGTLGIQMLPVVSAARYLIVLDAYRSGLQPGTVSMLPLEALMKRRNTMVSLHQSDLSQVLAMAELVGARPPGILFGVEPNELLPGETRLSLAVRSALPSMIQHILGRLNQLAIGCFSRTGTAMTESPPSSSPG